MGYYELEAKYLHYFDSSRQYEKLYGEYLEKYILLKREQELLIYKQRRVNAIISCVTNYQAKWDLVPV
jgi:hypothetical protein